MTARGYSLANFLRLLILGVWIVGLIWLLGGARYQMFIQARLWPLFVGAIALLMLFFAAAYARAGRPASHGSGGWERGGQVALLLLPLIHMLVGAASGGLGSDAFRQRSVAGQSGPGLGTPARQRAPEYSSEAVNEVTLLQLASDMEQLNGKRVTVVGRVYHPGDLPPDVFVLYRFIIVCCAADAIPIGAMIRHDDAGRMEPDLWLRVEGLLEAQAIDGDPAPFVVAEKAEPIDPPTNPYLSPF